MARGVSQTGLLDLPNELLELIIDPIVLDDWNTRLLFEKQWFLNLRYVCKLFDRIVSNSLLRKLNYDGLRFPSLPNDDAVVWWLMHEILRSINGGTVPEDLTKAVSCAVQAIVEWNLGSSTEDERYWKAACMLVTTYKGKIWVADQLLAAYSDVSNTSFHVTEGLQYLYILPMAAYYGNKSVVEKILKDGVDVNSSDKYLGNALHAAAHRGNTDMIQLLLDNGADVNSGCGNSPLHAAAMKGHEEAVRLLLKQRDIDVNSKNLQNQTPLLVAVKKRHTGVVRLLLERNDIDINFHNGDGRTALCQAMAVVGNEGIVELLLERSEPDIRRRFPWDKFRLCRYS